MPETKVLRFKEGRYEGEVNKAGDPEGEGSLEYPGNDEFLRQIYEGQFVNKKAHGKGTMRWNQGDKYEGDWKEGLRHGKGEYWSKVSLFDQIAIKYLIFTCFKCNCKYYSISYSLGEWVQIRW